MRKKSISDQCLAIGEAKKIRQQQQNKECNRLSRCRSDNKLSSNLNNLLHPSSVSNLSAVKSQSSRLFPKLFQKSKNKPTNSGVVRKNSLLLQTTAFLDYGSYEELNVKLDMIKQSVVDNLNKLKERDVSLQNLEMKADYLNQQALNLNMVSTNIKQKQKRKNSLRYRFLAGGLVFIVFSSIYSYLLYFGIGS